MKYLIVEDDLANQETLLGLIKSRDSDLDVQFCADRASGEQAIESQSYFDLIILDLSIPASEMQPMTHDVSHGLALLEIFRKRAPAAIIRVLTGFPEMDMASDYQNRYDVKTVLDVPALSFTSKRNMKNIADDVETMLGFVGRTNAIEIHSPDTDLTVPERRVLAQIGLTIPAMRENVSQFRHGRSGARSFRIDLYDANATPCGKLFAKIDTLERTNRELENYRRFVAPQLNVGSLPHLAGDRVTYYDRAALSYRLAQDYPFDLFTYLAQNAEQQTAVLRKLETIDDAWLCNEVPDPLRPLNLLERLGVSFEEIAPLLSREEARLIRQALESEVRFRRAIQHSDLHGSNILVTATGDPLLIDFGSVGKLPAPADAILLELSFALHPDSEPHRGAWPDIQAARNWCNSTEFAKDSPYREAICSCRDWAYRVVEQISTRAIFGSALAYSVRHQRFSQTRNEIAIAIALSCAERLLA